MGSSLLKFFAISAIVVFVMLCEGLNSAYAQYCIYCARPQNITTSSPPTETFQTGLQFQYVYRSHRTSDISLDRDEKVADSVANIYGLIHVVPDLSLEINAPIISRAYTRTLSESKVSTRETGIGDASLLGIYHIIETVNDQPYQWDIRGGLKLPTGDSGELKDERNVTLLNSGTLVRGRDLAFGSGSLDIPIGTRFTYQENGISSFADLGYIIKTEGDESYQYGNDLGIAAGLGVTAVQKPNGNLALGVIARFNNRGKDKLNGETLDNSGNSILTLGPTAQLSIREKFQFQVEVGVPSYRNGSGQQLLPDYLVQVQAIGKF